MSAIVVSLASTRAVFCSSTSSTSSFFFSKLRSTSSAFRLSFAPPPFFLGSSRRGKLAMAHSIARDTLGLTKPAEIDAPKVIFFLCLVDFHLGFTNLFALHGYGCGKF